MSTCPNCHRELILFRYGGADLLRCSGCQGFWFKKGTFRQVKKFGFSGLKIAPPLESPSGSAADLSDSAEMHCPQCRCPLTGYTYAYSSEIQLHRCTECQGIWASYQALLEIEQILVGYQESLDEAKAKALPIMLEVKRQFEQNEKTRAEERKRKKKRGLLGKFFKSKAARNRKLDQIIEDSHMNNNE